MIRCLGMAFLCLAITGTVWLGVPESLPKNLGLPDGCRAIPQEVTKVKEETGFSPPASKVDVIGAFKAQDKDKQESCVLLKDVLVLAIDTQPCLPQGQRPKDVAVVVALNEKDFKMLLEDAKKAETQLTLRISDNK